LLKLASPSVSTVARLSSTQKTVSRISERTNNHTERVQHVSRDTEIGELLHQAIERNQIILLLAEILKQKAWEESKNYVAAVRDLDNILAQTRESSVFVQRARKLLSSTAHRSRKTAN
jgi:Holliday junction resolvase RusA-like endonuclease